MKALEYEQKYKRPLKISKNILSRLYKDLQVLPFPIILKDIPINLIVDSYGNIIDNNEFIHTGIVAHKNFSL